MSSDDIDFDAVEKLMEASAKLEAKNDYETETTVPPTLRSCSAQSSVNGAFAETRETTRSEEEEETERKGEKSKDELGSYHRSRKTCHYENQGKGRRSKERHREEEQDRDRGYTKDRKERVKESGDHSRSWERRGGYRESRGREREESRRVSHERSDRSKSYARISKSRRRTRSRSTSRGGRDKRYWSSSYSRGRYYDEKDTDPHKEKEIILKEEEERKQRENEEARRDDLTVLVINLSLKSNERQIYEFFSEHAGKVRDVQCIRDHTSGKLKGIAYVEFYTPEAVIKALGLSGQSICGQPIRVQSSQAEKNRAAKAAKQWYSDPCEGPMRLYIGGLVETLSNISEYELKSLFSSFGEILEVDIHKDPYTGRSKGYAFVQFRKASEARDAMSAMNGFEIGGREIKVGVAVESKALAFHAASQSSAAGSAGLGGIGGLYSVAATNGNGNAAAREGETVGPAQQHQIKANQIDMDDNEKLDDDGGGLLFSATSKFELMQKLQREGNAASSILGNLSQPFLPNMNIGSVATLAAGGAVHQRTDLTGKTALGNGAPGRGGGGTGVTESCTGETNDPAALQQQQYKASANNLTNNIVLSNMFEESDVNLEEDPEFFNDICEDVKEECTRHGVVLTVWVNKEKVDGRVWVKFASIDQALRAFAALNGRYFGGKPVAAEFVSEARFLSTCK